MTMLSPEAAPFFDDLHIERVEGPGTFFHTYEFSIPANHPSAALAVPKGYVIFPDLDNQPKCLVIQEVDERTSPSGSFKRVTCEDAAQDELLGAVVAPVTSTDDTPAEMLTTILAGTRWEPGVVASASTLTYAWKDYPTAWECVLKVSELFGLEVDTRVEVRGGAITGRYIDLIEHRGAFTGKTVAYAKDTSEIQRLGDGGEVYTAMIGVGSDGLTFAASEWTTASGDPVDKPTGQIQVASPAALEAYGIPLDDGGKAHRVGVYRDPEVTVSGELLTKTWASLVEHSTPRYTYSASLAMLERVPSQHPGDLPRTWERIRVGDEVTVRDTSGVPYTASARVIEVQRSYTDATRDNVVLGKPSPRLSGYLRKTQLLWRVR